jgi:hypothetical protein
LSRWGLVAALLLAGCVEQAPPLDYGDPTALGRPTEVDGITAYVVSPKAGAALPSPAIEVEIAAHVAGQPEPLQVLIGPKNGAAQRATAAGEAGPSQRFRASVALVHGLNLIEVRIENEDRSRFRRLDFELLYDGQAPGLSFQLLAPATPEGGCEDATPILQGITAAGKVCVRGRVTTAAGTSPAEVQAQAQEQASVEPGDDGAFELLVTLAPDVEQTIQVKASDRRGRSTTGEALLTQDRTPPTLAITAPSGAALIETDEAEIALAGDASDAGGLASVRIESSKGSVQQAGGASPWQATVQLEPGDNDLAVIATDRAGNSASVPVKVVRSRVITLRPPAQGQSSTKLALDRTALSSLLTEDEQKGIDIATVALRPSIVAALDAIRAPEKYGIDTASWGPAEQNLSRLLNMTPDTADLKGTSVEELLSLGAAVGLPPARLLGDLLDRGLTETFLGVDVLTDVILAQVIATHPNATLDAQGAPIIEVNLHDVFQDLATLGPRFGPAGDHPGFLSGATQAKVLEAGFLMGIPIKTNLRQYDGVDASDTSKASLFRLEGDEVLQLDFTSPDFSIVGLADEPSVDLRIRIGEHPSFFSAGTQKEVKQDPKAPGFFLGDSAVWGAQPWQTERIVAEAAYRQNAKLYEAQGYKTSFAYDAGSIKNAAVITWDRGWVNIATSGGIGSPPPPQYAWDILLETAQVRLHDGGLPEGTADVAFSLTGLPIGLTADDLIAKVKPTLQAQSGELSKLIAGSSGLAESKADLFYVPAPGAPGFLFFRAEGDTAGPYSYKTPGFFQDAQLQQKVSSKTPSGGTDDATHEKVPVSAGLKVYFADDTGSVFRLEVVSVATGEVGVRVSPGGAS